MKKRFNNKSYKKAKVINNKDLQLRVLYKKVGLAPEIKIINDVENFKKSIILDKLDIIPYKHVFIICNNQEHKMEMPINVFFNLYHIAGDLIVVDIDKDKREFKSLTQDQLLYYSKDLIGREPNKIQDHSKYNTKIKTTKNDNYTPFERDIETDINTSNNSTNFEDRLINTLTAINLTLTLLLKSQIKK